MIQKRLLNVAVPVVLSGWGGRPRARKGKLLVLLVTALAVSGFLSLVRAEQSGQLPPKVVLRAGHESVPVNLGDPPPGHYYDGSGLYVRGQRQPCVFTTKYPYYRKMDFEDYATRVVTTVAVYQCLVLLDRPDPKNPKQDRWIWLITSDLQFLTALSQVRERVILEVYPVLPRLRHERTIYYWPVAWTKVPD